MNAVCDCLVNCAVLFTTRPSESLGLARMYECDAGGTFYRLGVMVMVTLLSVFGKGTSKQSMNTQLVQKETTPSGCITFHFFLICL